MGSGFLFLTIGMLFISGMFCLVIALTRLTAPQIPVNIKPMPRPADSEEGTQPQLTKLGRPIEEVKLSA